MKRFDKDRQMTKDLADSIDTSRGNNWLNPIAMSQLQKAVKAKQDQVSLGAYKFDIKYGVMIESKVLGTQTECIQLSRTDGGFVPMGFISVKRILDFKFENGE